MRYFKQIFIKKTEEELKHFGWVVILVLLAGCGGGGGGGSTAQPTGKTYGIMDWTPDLVVFDLTQIGVTANPVFKFIWYELKTGDATIAWRSNWLGCCIDYFLPVTIAGGKPGKDRLYYGVFSGNTLTWTTALVDTSAATIGPLDAGGGIPNLEPPDDTIYEEGVFSD